MDNREKRLTGKRGHAAFPHAAAIFHGVQVHEGLFLTWKEKKVSGVTIDLSTSVASRKIGSMSCAPPLIHLPCQVLHLRLGLPRIAQPD